MIPTQPPSAPIDLGQGELRIIAVICHWVVPEPEQTQDVELQLLYGDMVLYYERVPPEQNTRTFPVPMASTQYLLRVRTGNQAGWSTWSEAFVRTEEYPLIDSRLAVQAAAYAESVLDPGVWSGEVSDRQSNGADVGDVGFSFDVQLLGNQDAVTRAAIAAAFGVSDFRASEPLRKYTMETLAIGLEGFFAVEDFQARGLRREVETPADLSAVAAHFEVEPFVTARLLFQSRDENNPIAMTATFLVNDFQTEVPA